MADQPAPHLPDLAPPPPAPRADTLDWWKASALYWMSRAMRSELVQAFAVNVADEERTARQQLGQIHADCGQALQERDAAAQQH